MESIRRPVSFIRFFTLVALLLVAFSPSAFGQNAAVGNVPALAGAVASVPVDLAVNQTIRGFDFRLDYNPATVSFFKMVLEELGNTVPLSVSRREDIERLRALASDRFVPVK